jgi:hypothetical protein
MTGPPKKKAAARAGAAASETPNLIEVRPDHTVIAGEVPSLAQRPHRVITIKASGARVLFSKHASRQSAEAMVAGLAKIGCPAQIECSLDESTKPGERVRT